MSTKGIVLISSGKQYSEEACRAAKQSKKYMPGIPVTLFTDTPVQCHAIDQFELIESKGPYANKLYFAGRSPYERTLYLDTDAYVVADVSEVFDMLDRFDFLACHSPYRESYRQPDVPESFPEYNGGVFAYRRNDKTARMFANWIRIYEHDQEQKQDWVFPEGAKLFSKSLTDQPALRRAMYESDVRIGTLPAEYNCRLPFPGYLQGGVKVIHGRTENPEAMKDRLNTSVLPRAYMMRWGRLTTIDSAMPPGNSIKRSARWSIHYRGIVKTLTAAIVSLPKLVSPKPKDR